MKPLETERLLLRKFTTDDFDAVHSYVSVFENIIYMLWGPNTAQQTQAFINIAISKAAEVPCTNYQYAAVLKANNQLIGGCDLAVSGDEAEIGWILHRDFWNQGFGTEMGKAMLELGFNELSLHRIIAHCDAENQASYRVMEKIGMRREGLFLEGRPAHKLSNNKFSDELSYAILKGEWETGKEIAYYKTLSCVFDDFIELLELSEQPELAKLSEQPVLSELPVLPALSELPKFSDDKISLVCIAKHAAIPEKKYVPSYDFAICKGSEKVGEINLRIGYSGYGPDSSSLYYGGQIGYNVDEKHRGKGYAGRACRLLIPVAKAHGMTKLLITNDHTNTASRRVCEKLGAHFLRVARLPEWTDPYKKGRRFSNIFEWSVE